MRHIIRITLLFLLLQAAAGTSGARAGDIKIGMSGAFTGATRGLGIELYRGAMACIAHTNLHGGVFGKPLRIIARDDGYNPEPTITNTIQFIEKDDVLLLFNYVGTPTVTRMLPLLKKYSDKYMYLFFPFTGAQPQREFPYNQFVFNLRASYRQEVTGLVTNLVTVGRRRIAVFYQADAYGRSGWDGVKRALAAYGLHIVAEATYRRGAQPHASMKEQAAILMAERPDAVISVGAYAACAAFIRDARDAGLDAPIANVSFVDSENMIRLLAEMGASSGKDYTRNLINSQVVPSYEKTYLSAVAEYRGYMKKYDPMPPDAAGKEDYELQPLSPVSLEGYLNAKLLVEILNRTGPDLNRARIRDAVESVNKYDIGIAQPITFGPDKHQGLDQVYYTTVENFQSVPVTDWNRWRKP